MKEFYFSEAGPLQQFIENNNDRIAGHVITDCCLNEWHRWHENYISTDEPAIIELDKSIYVEIRYFFLSSLSIIVYGAGENSPDICVDTKARLKANAEDSIGHDHPIDKMIKGATVKWIELIPFSEAFECNAATGEIRPEGGDYFSTIRICFGNGSVLCFCAEDSIFDGYMDIWLD